jgi:hypothetical protein
VPHHLSRFSADATNVSHRVVLPQPLSKKACSGLWHN